MGHVKGRAGRTLHGTLPNKVTSLWRHYPRTGSPATLAAYDTGSAVEIRHDTASNGIFSAVTGGTGFATGKRFSFTNWGAKDRAFFANGDGLWSYNGVITSVVQSGTQILGPYVVVHQARLFGTRPDEINFSVYGTDIGDELTVGASNQISVNDPEGGSITGLTSRPDRLIVYKSTNVWTMLGDLNFSPIVTKLTEIGMVAPQSLGRASYGDYYVGRAGIFLTDGINPEPFEVSAPIRNLFSSPTSNTSYPNAVGIYYPRKDMYMVKLDPAHSYVYCVWRFKVPGKRGTVFAWSRHTNTPLVTGALWDSELDAGQVFGSDAAGNIYRLDDGLTDAGAGYVPVIQLPFMRLGAQQQKGRISYVYLNYRGSQAASVGLRYDNAAVNDLTLSMGNTQAIALQQIRTRVDDDTKLGHFVSAVVSLPSDGPTGEIYSVRLDSRLRSRRVWD